MEYRHKDKGNGQHIFTRLSDGKKIGVNADSKEMAMEILKSNTVHIEAVEKEKRGLGGSIMDFVTGANADPDIPEAQAAGLNLKPKQALQMIALQSTTLSDERMMNGLMKIEPQAQFDKDDNGNLIAVFPKRDEKGELIEGVAPTRFYANRPGLSGADALMLSGGAALANPVNRGIAFVAPALAKGYTGLIATGAAEASLLEKISNELTDSEFEPIVIPLGAIGAVAGDRALAVAKNLFNRTSGTYNKVFAPGGGLLPSIKKQIRELGLDIDDVTEKTARMFKEQVNRNVNPAEAIRSAEAKSLPVPVPLTKGQLTGSPGEQLFEDAASKQAFGEEAEKQLQDNMNRQSKALFDNVDAIQQQIAGDALPIARGEAGRTAQETLSTAREAAKKVANQNMDAARETGKGIIIQPEAKAQVSAKMNQVFYDQGGFDEYATPLVARKLKRLTDLGKKADADVNDFMKIRQQLSALRKGGDREAGAAGDVIRAFDEQMIEIAEKQLLDGNVDAIKDWKKATDGYREFKQLWETEGILKRLTDKSVRDGNLTLTEDPNDATQYIFGKTAAGLIDKKRLSTELATLQNQLPVEQWNGLRQEAFILLTDAGKGKVNPRYGAPEFSGVKFNKSWNALKSKNKELVNRLFSPEEQKLITQFGSVAQRATDTTKNTSNTAVSLVGIIGRLASSLGAQTGGRFLLNLAGMKMIKNAYGTARAFNSSRFTPRPQIVPSTGAGMGSTISQSPETQDAVSKIMRNNLGFSF